MIAKHKALHPLEFGLGLGLRLGGAGPSGYSIVNSEVSDFNARRTNPLDDADAEAVDDFITALKVDGTYTAIAANANAVMSIHAADRAASGAAAGGDCLLNFLSASNPWTVATGAPYRVAGFGVFFDGVDDALANQAPNAFAQNSLTIAVHGRQRDQRAQGLIGTATTSTVLVNLRNTSNKAVARINQSTTSTSTSSFTDGFGFTAAIRSASNVLRIFTGATKIDNDFTTASAAPSAIPLNMGRINSSYIENQVCFSLICDALTEAQEATLANAVATLMEYFGADYGVGRASGVQTTSVIPRIDQKVFPDGANPELAGRGFPSTGWSNAPDGTRWAGWGLSTMSANAGLVHLSAPAGATDATCTLLAEYATADIFATVPGYTADTSGAANTYPPTSSTQGVGVDNEMSANDYDIWWVIIDSTGTPRNYLCRANWNGTTLTGTSCNVLPNANVNAAVRDKRGVWWAKDSETIRKSTVTDGVLAFASPAINFLNIGGTADQLAYDFDLDILFVTGGANSVDGYVNVIPLIGNYGGPYFIQQLTITDGLGMEGAYYNASSGNIETVNDQYTHVEASFPYNALHINGPVGLLTS